MTPQALAALARLYRDRLSLAAAHEPIRYSDRRQGICSATAQLDHALWMLDGLEAMAQDIADVLDRLPSDPVPDPAGLDLAFQLRRAELKAHRWLGFVQGVLWTAGLYTIDELRAHVSRKPSKPK